MITRRCLIQSGTAFAAALSAPTIARAAGKRVRLAHAGAETTPGQKLATSFTGALEELMPGAFNVQIFPNRQLGGDKQLLEGAVAGTMDLAIVSSVLIPLVTGRMGMDAWQLPFLVRDYDMFGKLALGEAGLELESDLSEAGLIGLGTANFGQRHFLSTKKPVQSVADFEGLKTRIVPVPLHKQIWEAMGTAPVGLPYGEVYGALETGVIDAVEINVQSMLGENLWEVGKYFTLTGHYPWPVVNMASQRFWDTLGPEEQAAFAEAGRRSVVETVAFSKALDASGREELKAKGVEIIELSGLDQMRAKSSAITEGWSGKDPLIADFVAAASA